ncbi:hypothetical protein GS4_08_01460 [Gordonia soli NBRC 108243]|uniref:DUF1772 domain-containing protein n=1 Tax=Gordonia soli NBRC 108243 TaxID=1223545 RepID=M0QGX6_9ACTN|nr:hypothetical protein GS4_08_01460 [Gordonia soli NBRC 108243]
MAVGAVVGLLAPLPLALLLRHVLDLPEVEATPISRPLTATYWLPWTLSWLTVNLPGVALLFSARTRHFGRWFLIASLLISTVVVWFYFVLEYKGFSPD